MSLLNNCELSTNSDSESEISEISSISVKSISLEDDNDSLCSSPIIYSRFPSECHFKLKAVQNSTITNKDEVISTFDCIYYETEVKSILNIYIENFNLYSFLNKATVIKLLEFIEKIGVKESYVYVNRGHSEYSKLII